MKNLQNTQVSDAHLARLQLRENQVATQWLAVSMVIMSARKRLVIMEVDPTVAPSSVISVGIHLLIIKYANQSL